MRMRVGIWSGLIGLVAAVVAGAPATAQTWTQHNKGVSTPPARWSPAIAHDSGRQRVVLFGGASSTWPLDDTWEWDGSTWTLRSPVTRPTARVGCAMAYDSARRRVVLFGGQSNFNPENDTWEWDGTTWTRRNPANSPPAKFHHAMAYDSVRRRTVLFGGSGGSGYDTWEWDGNNWSWRVSKSSPPVRLWHGMAYDAARQRTVLFGGLSNRSALNDTWEWDGTNWTQRTPSRSPPSRNGHAMAYDSARQRTVLFGGFSSQVQTFVNDTWEWDGSNWLLRAPSSSPSARYNHVMAYDAGRQRVVLVSGTWLSTLPNHETWEYGFAATVAASGTARPGATVNLVLTAASDAGLFYQAGSSLGTGPIPVGSRRIGLSPDALLQVSAGNLWPWIFRNYRGTLDQRGQAAPAIHVPNLPALVGTRIHTAFVTMDPKAPWGIRSISATVTVAVTP